MHVLVTEDLEGHPEFFYPSRTSRLIRTRDGRLIDIRTARVEVAEIPYVRLRSKLSSHPLDPEGGFAPAIEHAQHTLDTLLVLPPLTIELTNRRVSIGATPIPLEPLQIVLYAQFALARKKRFGEEGFLRLDEMDDMHEEILRRYQDLYGPYSGHVENFRRAWGQRIPPERLRSIRASINHMLRQAMLDNAQAELYMVTSKRRYAGTRYGLLLPPERIELRE